MKLTSDSNFGLNTITGYGPGYVAVNNRRYEGSVIVDPKGIQTDWEAKSVESLTAEQLQPLLGRQCDVILIGTGDRQRFPSPAVMRPLIESLGKARVGVEIMDTAAACRTYNILAAEGRNPVAALIVE